MYLALCVRLTFLLQGLRYKDYHLVAPPAPLEPISASCDPHTKPSLKSSEPSWSFEEVETVKEFGKEMEHQGVLEWWRKAMDFAS